jgi:hypothetical protein
MAAFTAVGDYRYYPQYVNIEVHDGQLRFIVRSPESLNSTQAQMSVPLDEAERLLEEALADVRTALHG